MTNRPSGVLGGYDVQVKYYKALNTCNVYIVTLHSGQGKLFKQKKQHF